MTSRIRNGERKAIEALIAAKHSGRKIVPFLGAGISAGSGFPLVEAIRLYLLKVRYFIQYGAYRSALGLPSKSASPITDPEQNPSRYLTDFGWPNPNQLNSDLNRVTALGTQETPSPFENLIAWKGLFNNSEADGVHTKLRSDVNIAIQGAEKISKETQWIDLHIAKIFSTLLETPPILPIASTLADELTRFVRYLQTTRRPNARWGRRRWRLTSSALFAQLEDIRLYDRRLAEAIEEKVWSMDLAPTTDWARHLMQLSEGNLNLIDALFSMLGLRYAPGLSHRMMAQLVKGLNLPLLLTINFDPYLEQALQEEGISPRVLDVSRDDDPPDVAVVKQALSIIKLHGSSHSIRLGERLDYALDDDTRSRVANFVGKDALLLIVGFSGYERRMMQLIDHLATGPALSNQLRVLWMHFEPEDELPGTLRDFERRLRDIGRGDLLLTARLADAGEFLFHFYQRAMDSYPRVRVPVTILPKRIVDLPKQPKSAEFSVDDPAQYEANDKILDEIPIQFFVAHDILDPTTDDTSAKEWDSMSSLEASVMLSQFVQSKKGYNVIWIDLEEHHTVAGVVTEVIDRMRVFDPDLSPLIQPVERAEKTNENDELHGTIESLTHGRDEFDKPVRFLHRALRRGRYILAFDSLEDFGREHTSHHGLPSDFRESDPAAQNRKLRLIRRVNELLSFILRLVEAGPRDGATSERVWDLDWYCGVACSKPEPRHDPMDENDRNRGVVQPVVEAIGRFFTILEKETLVDGSSVVSRVLKDRNKFAKMSLMSTRIAVTPMYPIQMSDFSDSAKHLWMRFHEIEEDAVAKKETESNYNQAQREITSQIDAFSKTVLEHRFPVSKSAKVDLAVQDHWLKMGSHDSDFLPVLTLAAARRPRSFVGIRNLWCEYLPQDWSMTRAKKTEAVSKKLDWLEEQGLIRLMAGGFYWMPHRLHRKAYRLLTEPIRKRRINQLRQKLNDRDTTTENEELIDEIVSSATRLVFVVTIHSRLARFYYLHVFQRTRDANAMFEYLYHRVTSLKYLNLLLALLHDTARLPRKRNAEVIGKIRDSVSLLVSIEGQRAGTNHDTGSPRADLTQVVVRGLDRLRERLLQAFLNVFEREQEVFLSLGSADTWLAWIEQIKDHDLRDLIEIPACEGGVTSGNVNGGSNSRSGQQVATESRARRMARLRDRLRGRLEDLHATLLREKRDWKECVRNRLKHLQVWFRRTAILIDSGVEDAPSHRNQLESTIHPLQGDLAPYLFHLGSRGNEDFSTDLFELVKTVSNLERDNEQPSTISKVISKMSRLLVSGRTGLSTWSASDLIEELNRFLACLEDVARCLHHDRKMTLNGKNLEELVKAEDLFRFSELLLASIRIESNKTKGASRPGTSSREVFSRGVREVIACIDTWEVRITFERIRLRFEKHDLWSRAPSAEVKQEMQRHCADLEEARHRTRGTDTTNPVEFPLRRCQLRTLQASILTFLGRCRESRLALAHAETGLTEETLQQRFQLAVVAEFKAQTWMKQADQVLDWYELHRQAPRSSLLEGFGVDPEVFESWEKYLATRSSSWKAARGHLDDASQALLIAERLLQSGRRSTGQSLRLYSAKAQLEIENLLLMLFGMDGDEMLPSLDSELHFRAQLYNMLHRGVEAIRGGWDCVQAASSINNEELAERERSPWLAKWSQLMITGYIALERYSRIAFVAHARSVSESAKRLHTDASTDRVDRTFGDHKKIAEEQDRMAALEGYMKLWRAINESVGLERFMEIDVDEPRWKALLEKSNLAAESMEDEIESRRQRAKKLTEIMVWQETAENNGSRKWIDLQSAYSEWRDHRVRSSNAKRKVDGH